MSELTREQRFKAAQEMVSALCKPRGSAGSREWVMSIPARRGYDPDLVISDGLMAGQEAERECVSLRARCEELERESARGKYVRAADIHGNVIWVDPLVVEHIHSLRAEVRIAFDAAFTLGTAYGIGTTGNNDESWAAAQAQRLPSAEICDEFWAKWQTKRNKEAKP